MARTKRWVLERKPHAAWHVALSHWKYFGDFVYRFLASFDKANTVWRGQAASKWTLETTIERAARISGKTVSSALLEAHLAQFRLAVRGRRGVNPARLDSEDDWWALGQHYGLATPLLDWTSSPFVALYFAFLNDDCDGDSHRAVWGLHPRYLRTLGERARQADAGASVVTFIEPLSDENARLVNQGGLFTRSPTGQSLTGWVTANTEAEDKGLAYVKVSIPNKDQADCLRMLSRMNINHLSLFPDLYGASEFCNARLRLR